MSWPNDHFNFTSVDETECVAVRKELKELHGIKHDELINYLKNVPKDTRIDDIISKLETLSSISSQNAVANHQLSVMLQQQSVAIEQIAVASHQIATRLNVTTEAVKENAIDHGDWIIIT